MCHFLCLFSDYRYALKFYVGYIVHKNRTRGFEIVFPTLCLEIFNLMIIGGRRYKLGFNLHRKCLLLLLPLKRRQTLLFPWGKVDTNLHQSKDNQLDTRSSYNINVILSNDEQ